MLHLLYSLFLAAALVLTLPYWLFRMLRHGKYHAGLAERLGRVPARLTAGENRSCPAETIWVHAVSVGEVLAISALVTEIRRRLPRRRVVVSTTTDTGQALARQRLGDENVFYFPMDFALAIRPYLRALQPSLVILAETEFWPNFLRLARSRGARIAVVNARISDRSWPSYRRFRWAIEKMLSNIDLFLAQTDEDARRLESIGAPPDRIRITGNLKFDISLPAPPALVETLRRTFQQTGTRPVLVCGSTVEGEESLLLKAFEKVLVMHPHAIMILAPRHPERFDTAAALLDHSGIAWWRRSSWKGEPITAGVLLLDSMGELTALYALADLAFVGGSLVTRGGHNILEPAAYGVATVVGTHTENFRDIVGLFRSRNAVRIVRPAELSLAFMELLAKDSERVALGQRAAETVRCQTGATRRTLEALENLLGSSQTPLSSSAQAAHTD